MSCKKLDMFFMGDLIYKDSTDALKSKDTIVKFVINDAIKFQEFFIILCQYIILSSLVLFVFLNWVSSPSYISPAYFVPFNILSFWSHTNESDISLCI